MEERSRVALASIVNEKLERSQSARRIAEWIAAERAYRWVGLYEVTPTDIGMIACTGSTPPAFPRFPISEGLCGAAVASKSIINVGNVQQDPRWLTTFGSTRSEIIVPVFTNTAQVAGLIDVESNAPNAFAKHDEDFLAGCAALIASLF